MSIEIKQILQKLNTNPQKKLGQNFLINKNKIKKLISEINKVHYDSIIEIGPGLGAITEELIKNNNIICIEKNIKKAKILVL
jgi:16S rRNA (adenine1518-N6/adenine1519-N6)-dimethyltransferase